MTPDEYETLYARLNKSGHDHMPPDMLDGYLCAIIASPDAMSPLQWIPHVFFRKEMPEFSSMEELSRVTDALFTVYNTMVTRIAKRDHGLVIADGPAKTTRESLTRWCEGFISGYEIQKEKWERERSIGLLTTMGHILQLSVYSLKLQAGQKPEIPSFVRTKKQILAFTREIRDFIENTYFLRLEQFSERGDHATRPGSSTSRKPRWGRNQPCPCGSGIKYKKCCGKIE